MINEEEETSEVGLRVIKPIENINRNLTADNWYTSTQLVEELKKKTDLCRKC